MNIIWLTKIWTFNSELNASIKVVFEAVTINSEEKLGSLGGGEVVEDGGAVFVQEIPHQLSLVEVVISIDAGVKH